MSVVYGKIKYIKNPSVIVLADFEGSKDVLMAFLKKEEEKGALATDSSGNPIPWDTNKNYTREGTIISEAVHGTVGYSDIETGVWGAPSIPERAERAKEMDGKEVEIDLTGAHVSVLASQAFIDSGVKIRVPTTVVPSIQGGKKALVQIVLTPKGSKELDAVSNYITDRPDHVGVDLRGKAIPYHIALLQLM